MRCLLLVVLGIAGCHHANGADWKPFGKSKTREVAVLPKPAPKEEAEHETIKQSVLPQPPDELYLELPEQVEGDIDDWVLVEAKTNGLSVKWVATDKNLKMWPSRAKLDSPLVTYVRSITPGKYQLLAYTAMGSVLSDPVATMVVVHGPQPPPIPPVPPPNPVPPPPNPVPPPPNPVPPPPPPNPTPITADKLYVAVIDDWGTRTPDTTAVLTNQQFWAGLTAAGHRFKQIDGRNQQNPEYRQYLNQITANGGLPCVVIMAYDPANTKTATWLNKDPADLKLPATVDGFRQLVSKYSGR